MTSHGEIDRKLTAAGEFFEIEELEIRGGRVRTWKNAPASLRDVFGASRAHPSERPFIVLGDERLGYAEHTRRVVALAHRLVDELGVRPGDRVVIGEIYPPGSSG